MIVELEGIKYEVRGDFLVTYWCDVKLKPNGYHGFGNYDFEPPHWREIPKDVLKKLKEKYCNMKNIIRIQKLNRILND